jgi:hypothetical protein
MTTEQPPSSETDKLAATLAALEAERAARQQAGKSSRGTTPVLIAIIPEGETLAMAQQRALYAHLAEHLTRRSPFSFMTGLCGRLLRLGR